MFATFCVYFVYDFYTNNNNSHTGREDDTRLEFAYNLHVVGWFRA